MAEFVADGHKYGVKWAVPWTGAVNTINFTNALFTIDIGGATATLGMTGYGHETNDSKAQPSWANGKVEYYFRLSYVETTGAPAAFQKTFVQNLWKYRVSSNVFLVRATIERQPSTQKSFVAYAPSLFEGAGGRLPFPCTKGADNSGNLYFEFSADNSPKVTEFSIKLDTNGDTADSAITENNNVFIYLDNYEQQVIGAGVGVQYPDAAQINTVTIAKPQPLNCVYRNNGGGGYM